MAVWALIDLAKWQAQAHRALDYILHLLLPALRLCVLLLNPNRPPYQLKGGLFMNFVVGKSPAILELTQTLGELLLIQWDTFPLLDLCFDTLDCVRGLDIIYGDGLPLLILDKYLHWFNFWGFAYRGRDYLTYCSCSVWSDGIPVSLSFWLLSW